MIVDEVMVGAGAGAAVTGGASCFEAIVAMRMIVRQATVQVGASDPGGVAVAVGYSVAEVR